jgi:hypothetical protein
MIFCTKIPEYFNKTNFETILYSNNFQNKKPINFFTKKPL